MKVIRSGLTACLVLIATGGLLQAQENKVALQEDLNFEQGIRPAMSSGGKLPEMQVNIKAVRNFVKQFKQTDSIAWCKVRDGYIVNYLQKGSKIRTGYDINGNWLYNLVSYTEDKLPRDVWHRVKSTFYDFSITLVNEIKAGSGKIYIVHMKNNNFFQNVRVCEGELEVIEQLTIDPDN